MTKDIVGAEVLHSLKDLLDELSSEIDLHYDDDEFLVTSPTIEKMRAAGEILRRHSVEQPDAFRHVLERFDLAATSAA